MSNLTPLTATFAFSAQQAATAASPGVAQAARPRTLDVDDLLAILSAGGDLDPVSIILMTQMAKADKQVTEKMTAIEQLGKLRDSYATRLDELRQMKEFIRQHNGDDHDETVADGEDGFAKQWNVNKVDFAIDAGNGGVTKKIDGRIGTMGTGGDGLTNMKQLEVEEERVKGKLQSIDSQNDIEMIKLNSLINKKGQVTQLLSNILKKYDETSRSVIGNFR